MQPMQPHGNNRWDGRDDVSFEDSERFEEDSQVSLEDSTEDSQHNWRGWTDFHSNNEAIQPGLSCVVHQYHSTSGRFSSASTRTVVAGDPNQKIHPMMLRGDNPSGILLTLSEFAAKICAERWSFQQLEEMHKQICLRRSETMEQPFPIGPIPEKIFLSFIVHCFPRATDEIRMYSTLANGTADQYEFGKLLYQWGNVRDVSQTGFLLSGDVSDASPDAGQSLKDKEAFHVTVKVDRCRIVECTCECSNRSSWCKHVVALCIYRISERSSIKFKETIADAINSMNDEDLRKLLQWHINDIPRKCIPGFQKLIDQIKDKRSMINNLPGAPDPTDGGHEPISRYDFPEVETKIRRLLIKYCVPAPAVHCDVAYLNTVQHPTHIEWTTMIKPFRSKEPEGMWNLLQMIREMFARNDDNAVALLRTITDECLSNSQVILWWYISKLVQSGNWSQNTGGFKAPDTQYLAQLHCSELLDEIVDLWKLVAINPRAGKEYRFQLAGYLEGYHRTAVARLKNMITSAPPITNESMSSTDITALSNYQISVLLQTVTNVDVRYPLSSQNMKFTLNCFPGFHPAIQMCHYLNEQDIRFGVTEDAIFYVSQPNLAVSYKMVPPQREKSLKKKKKKRRLSKKGLDEVDESPTRPDEYRGVDGIWRVVTEGADDNEEANDSTESGQESDVQKEPTRQESAKKKKMDSVENDVNEVLAASFTPLDALEARFLKIEAYGAHGFRADAIEHALRVIEYLMDSLSEQCNEMRKLEEELPCTSKQSTSSSSSCVSEEITEADREEEIARSNRFLLTIRKILYITKVLKDSPNLQPTVFDISMRCLSLTKYPFFTKYHQILFTYLETEFVAILDQIWQNYEMGVTQMDKVRMRAKEIVETDVGNNGELPPIALTKFLFLALYWTESGANRTQNANGGASAALQHNRRLLIPTDSDLALHVSLHIIGCRPLVSEKHTLHWETIRREKSELTAMLLVRYKDSQERCALVIDKILDPKLHRMYQHHHSNAAYFLERCPEYLKRFKPGQRPVFPYPKDEKEEEVVQEEAAKEGVEKEEDENALTDYQAQIEAELARLNVEHPPMPPAPISRTRGSDESCSTSSDTSNKDTGSSKSRSTDSTDSDPNVPGPSSKPKPFRSSPRKNPNGSGRKSKKRVDRSVSYDPGSTVNEAAVYHMTELSKKILLEAGGSQNSIVWAGHNMVGTNRRLHLCAIAVSIYALGMSNRISPNWTTRTYNNIASWIASQTEEVGHHSLEMLRELWIAHFTPNEVAQISQRVAPVSEVTMKQESAKLALSVLPYAHALTDEEVIHALRRCKNESREMLVAALVAMDTRQFREIGRSRPLFEAMTHWHELSYQEEPARQQHQQQPNPQMHWQPQMQQWQPQEPPQAAPQQQNQPWHAQIDQWQPEQAAAPVQQQQGPPPPLPPAPQVQQQQQAAPAGLVPNPFIIYFQNPAPVPQAPQPPPPPRAQPNARHNNRNNRGRQPPPPLQHPPQQNQNIIVTPAQQVIPIPHGAWLYPQVYEADHPHLFLAPPSYRAEIDNRFNRIPQSRSAPQLQNKDKAAPMPAHDQQYIQPPPPTPTNALMNAWHYGMRALDCMGTSPGEERHMYLKYGESPPYKDEITNLHYLSMKLGLEYLGLFYKNASRSILSPYLLRDYVKDSITHFPHFSNYNANNQRPHNSPQPLIPPHFIPSSSKHPGNIRYPNVRITTPGQITNHVIHAGYHPITGELFERCCEQWLQAVVNKMNSPRATDQVDFQWNAQLCDLIHKAYDTFMWIPNGRQYFEEFVRAVKRLRGYNKKDVQMATNSLLQQLCIS